MEYSLLLSAIQGLLAAAAVWQTERNHTNTVKAYEDAKALALEDPIVRERASALEGVLPSDVAAAFLGNIEACWDRHKSCISGANTHDEHEYCEVLNQECICSNLKFMANANGCLPSEFIELWNTWACGVKPRIC